MTSLPTTDLSRTILTAKTSSQSGTLTRRGPGLTISQFVQGGGKLIESAVTIVFDRFKGPEHCKSRIIKFFGDQDDCDERQAVLDELHTVLQHVAQGGFSRQHKGLRGECHRLLKHARKSQSIDTQLLTFKILGRIVTRYPGLRRCLRDHKDLQNKTEQDFETLWMREVQSCGEEWNFHRGLAAFLLSDSNLAKLVETAKPSELGLVKLEEGNLNKVPIEELLGWCRSGPDFDPPRLSSILYLEGILELPSFWIRGGVDSDEERFLVVLSDLCGTIFQLVDETGAKMTDSSVDTSPAMSAARTAVDRFCAVVLNGILQLKNRRALPSPVGLHEILDMLTSEDDTMATIFPSSTGRAPLVRELLHESSSPDSRPQTPRPNDDAPRPSGDARSNDSTRPIGDAPHPSDNAPPNSGVGAVHLEPDSSMGSRHASDIVPPNSSGEPNADAGINSVVISSDGRRIVSGSDDKTLRVWDAATGAALAEPLEGHTDRVNCVASSPDGRCIVSGSADKTLRVWDADAVTGAALTMILEGHTDWVNSVAFSPDGGRIVSGSADQTLRVWDAATGAVLAEPLEGHTHWVNSVAFSPDGGRIVSGSADQTLRVWDAATGAALTMVLEGHTNYVNSVAFSYDGRRIVSGSDDKTLRVWDAVTGAALGKPLEGHTARVNSVTV